MSIMNWKDSYEKKRVTAKEAAALIQSGDKIILLPVNSMPIDILNALAARKEELHKVKIASNLMTYPFAFVNGDYAGHITYYSGYFGPLERMFHVTGECGSLPHAPF